MKRSNQIPEMRHLPFSVIAAIRDLLANKEANKKLKENYFKDRLTIIAAIPKSASSVIGSCVAEILSMVSKKSRSYAKYMLANRDSDLRPELVKDFPKGGVLKFHTRATGKNLKVLELLGVKYIILLRHPADQIVALYCNICDYLISAEEHEKNGWVKTNVYPVPGWVFRNGVDINESLQCLIREGYLNATLSWMVDWLRFRNAERSLILKYEDFVLKTEETLNVMSNFLVGFPVSQDCAKKCNVIVKGAKKHTENNSSNSTKYPRGWTGKIGIWKNYFSDTNKNDYRSTVKDFLDYYPNASLLQEVYTDLMDID
ncbi:MAG: sulfotransferase domain-containing protein [Candidatus Omnitrophota bacterium]